MSHTERRFQQDLDDGDDLVAAVAVVVVAVAANAAVVVVVVAMLVVFVLHKFTDRNLGRLVGSKISPRP